MSHFYGTIDGSASTQATRCGTKNSGITTNAAGWTGSIRVDVWHDKESERDHYRVILTPWQGSGGESRILAKGLLNARLGKEEERVIAELDGVEITEAQENVV